MNFKNEVKEVTDMDLDPNISKNTFLYHFVLGSVYDLPVFDDEKFDMFICNRVIEHIEHPQRFVSEILRVLKPGGYFLAKATNRNNYMPLAARLTPFTFHKWYYKRRERPEKHTFPMHYSMNTRGVVKKYFSNMSFDTFLIKTFDRSPSCLRFNFIFYFIGWIYERVVTIFRIDSTKMVMIFSVRKSGKIN